MGASEFQEAYTRLVEEFELAQRILDMLNSREDLFGADVVRCYTGNSAGSILQFEVRK